MGGPILSPTINNSGWLKYYSHIFDYVEIDSSFYRIPSPFMVKNWYKWSTHNFRLTAKFPKIITHDKRLKDVDKELERFFEAFSPLADKTLALLIQLPPSLHIFEGLERLRDLVPDLDNRFRYEVEVRHSSWFQDLAYNFFANNDLCLGLEPASGIANPTDPYNSRLLWYGTGAAHPGSTHCLSITANQTQEFCEPIKREPLIHRTITSKAK